MPDEPSDQLPDELPDFVLTFACPDRTGIVHAVSAWLLERQCNIIDSDQFGDPYTGRFFMRVHFAGPVTLQALQHAYNPLGREFAMQWQLWPMRVKPRVLVMVSRLDHCLADLLYRTRIGELPIDVELVVSNHRDTYALTASHDVDFLHLPVTPDTKADQERMVLEEVDRRAIDLVVLARYMQVLSDDFCARLEGRIINIHHSFLPSFKGARPYHQAHDRGVKLIGATAHYVTADLDEGPIIEQGAERVTHRHTPAQLVAMGRDIERSVLAKAVRYHAEQRILMNGDRTVVFA